jgi:hypothetical protein
MTKFTTFFLLVASLAHASAVLDRKENIDGIMLESSKEGTLRNYHAQTNKNLPYALKSVSKSILNFADRCNNSHKDLRKFMDKKRDCKYHSENLIESFEVTELKTPFTNTLELEQHLIGKQIYNRGHYGFYELVEVKSQKNPLSQNQIVITQKMLNDEEVKEYTSAKFPQESSFKTSHIKYVLTETSATSTRVDYYSDAQTEHWILNKELSIPQVFASLGKSIQELFKSVELDSFVNNRGVASETK